MNFYWDHRIVKVPCDDEQGYYYQLAEVHYVDGVPQGWSEAFMVGDTIEEMVELADRLKAAASQPIIEFPANQE